MFFGVSGRPFLDLSPFVELRPDECVDEITAYIASSPPHQHVPFSPAQEIHSSNPDATHLGKAIRLIGIRDISAETLERTDRSYLEPASRILTKTMSLLRTLPLKGLGRASIYYTAPGESVPTHRDYAEYPGFNNQFLYLNPLRKPFFVLDEDGTKQFLDTPVSIFNPSDFHGMDVCDQNVFTIRVNGFWEDWLVEATGLERYFAGRD